MFQEYIFTEVVLIFALIYVLGAYKNRKDFEKNKAKEKESAFILKYMDCKLEIMGLNCKETQHFIREYEDNESDYRKIDKFEV